MGSYFALPLINPLSRSVIYHGKLEILPYNTIKTTYDSPQELEATSKIS